MSIIDSIRYTFDNLLVPRDGLFEQASKLVDQADSDGDRRVSIAALQAGYGGSSDGLSGITTRGFIAADQLGNGDGYATVKEVRSLLKRYDVAKPWERGTEPDGRIDGYELILLLGDLSSYQTRAQKDGPSQAGRGAAQLT